MPTPDPGSVLLKGLISTFKNLGSGARVFLFLLVVVILLPWILRILSFFRRGGSGV